MNKNKARGKNKKTKRVISGTSHLATGLSKMNEESIRQADDIFG